MILIRRVTSLFYWTFLCTSALFAQGIQYEEPRIEGFHPLDNDVRVTNPFATDDPSILELKTHLFSDSAIIDFENRQITFMRVDKQYQLPVWSYHYGELDQYLLNRRQYAFASLWFSMGKKKYEEKEKKGRGIPKLDFQLPVHYPAWARRVLGDDPPTLSIKGFQEIGFAYDKRSSTADIVENSGSPDFKHDNDFTIRGSVGRLINVEIKAGTEQDFEMSDPLKDLKIVYKEDSLGELEDEIIQEVVAGYTNFEMPGSGLSGYSESHEGLFGVKIRSKFGPLMLTTIASHEQGKIQTDTINLTGDNQAESVIHEDGFEPNRYFFLDSAYLRQYLDPSYKAPPVTKLKVYHKQRAVSSDNESSDLLSQYVWALTGEENIKARYKVLREDEHYELFKEEGYIIFRDSANIDNNSEVALYMETAESDSIGTKGDTSVVISGGDRALANLWVLKPEDPEPTDSTFHLMWRNVYRIPQGAEQQDFKLTIKRITSEDTLSVLDGREIGHILGITNEKGNVLKEYQEIFDFSRGFVIFPPFDDPETGNRPFANPALGANNSNDSIYLIYHKDPDFADLEYKYDLSLSGNKKKTEFMIGWETIPGTEVLYSGGTKLERDRDYIIDYDMGRVELISPLAKSATSLKIERQKEQMFVFDRKTFLGAHGKIDLPSIGRGSYIGSSVLYQNTAAREEVPRLGQEPFSRLLLAMNTKLDFEPQWMTQVINLLPGVQSNMTSSFTFDAEIAHSRITPSAGSEAYVDDFESSNRDFDMSISHESWTPASPPQDISDNLLHRPPAWYSFWYRTVGNDRTRRTDIWKIDTATINTRDELYISTLKWRTRPAPPNELNSHYDRPWSGIMTNIPGSLADKEDDRYLEIWVKKPPDGVLYIDMGEVSEDLCIAGGPPNNNLDREDTLYTTDPNRRNDSLDTGLDTLWDRDEIYLYPNRTQTGWDTLRYGDSLLGEFVRDPARDNFRVYNTENTGNRRYANGYQGNKYLESEDIDYDGVLDKREHFFRAKIPFDSLENHQYKVENANAASDQWVKLWIPLNDTTHLDTIIGSPSWKKISFLRLWWSDFENNNSEPEMEIASIKFIGNEWRSTTSIEDSKIEATVLNTEDDTGYYYPPPLMRRERDEGDNDLLKREQALRLRYENLNGGEEALVERHLSYQNMDLSSYDEIKMYVNVLDLAGTDPGSWFVYRFGTNDSTYYEYRKRLGGLREGWITGVAIDLKELSRMKLDSLGPGTAALDSISIIQTLPDGGQLRIVSANGETPTYSRIKWMAFGISRDESASPNDNGEIWVDGLRVAGMKPMSGWAFRSSLNTSWSDFMDLNANVNYDDADFRRMSDNTLTARDSRLNGALNATWTLDKFLPASWGVSVPLGTSVSSSISRPKIKPGSDISLAHTDGSGDGFNDMAADFVGSIINRELSDTVTRSEHFEKSEVNRSWYVSYSKNVASKNPLINLTLDRITADYQYNRDTSIVAKGSNPDGSGDYVEVSSNRRHSNRLGYDLSPGVDAQNLLSWRPFKDSKTEWLPRSFYEYRLSLLPSTINFDLADITYSKTYRRNSETELEQETRQFELTHKFQFSYSPIQPLIDMDYNISVARDLNTQLGEFDPQGRTGSQYAWDFFKEHVIKRDNTWRDYWVLNGESSRDQRFQLRFEPKLFDWLTHTADYSSTYGQNPQRRIDDSTSYLKSEVKTDFGFRSDFRVHSLLGVLAEKTGKIKGLGGMLAGMEQALAKINFRSINFTYNANMDLINQHLDRSLLRDQEVYATEFFMYQLGFLDRRPVDWVTGNMDDEKAFGGMHFRGDSVTADNEYDQRYSSQDWRISTSFRIPGALDLSFNRISVGWNRAYKVEPDTTAIDTTITWPEVGIGASTGILRKVPFLEKHMRSMNVRSNFTYSNRSEIRNTGTSNYFNYSFSPLISFTGTMKKWPVNVTYSHDFSVDSSRAESVGDNALAKGEREQSNTDRLTVSHSIRANRVPEIKILRWKIPIRGELAWGLEASRRSVNNTNNSGALGVDYVEYMIRPHMAYDFTDNVRGTMSYTGKRADKKEPSQEQTNDHHFEVLVRITF